MRILISVATYYPDNNGVQNVTQYQAEGLASLGHTVTVVSSDSKGKYPANESFNGVSIIRFPAVNKYMFHFGNRKKYQNLILQLSKEVDIIIGVCIESYAVDWLLPILNAIPVPCFVINHGMHDFRWNRNNFSSISEILKKILRDARWGIFYRTNWRRIRLLDGIAFLHEKDYAYDVFRKHNCSRCFVIYNAVPDDFFEEALDKKKHIVINVGSFNARKNQKMCLRVFYRANTRDYSLILIGNPQNKYYRSLVKLKSRLDIQYGVKEVQILCNINRVNTVEIIKQSEIYLMTSTWEAFPISIIEAISAGVVFVSSDVGVNRFLCGGYIGNNENELVSLLEKAISEDVSLIREKAKAFANANLRQVTQVEHLERCLQATIRNGKSV